MVLTADKVGNVLTSILMLVAVLRWMQSSRRGLEIRAMMMNPHAASIVGIGVRRTSFYVMAITGSMAGLAAVLLSQTYYISPFGGLTPMIKGVSIALCGGLGSVRGAVIAAMVLGLNESLTTVYDRRSLRPYHPVSFHHRYPAGPAARYRGDSRQGEGGLI